MGDIADSIINGEFDEQTGEYIGEPCGYPRTLGRRDYIQYKESPEEKEIRRIRKELAILINIKKLSCITDKEINNAISIARQEINIKYGKGWREKH